MSASNFDAVMRLVLQHEGGYSTDSQDPGNWTGGKVGVGKLLGTKYGIAANTFPNLDIARLTKEQAVAIYARQYAAPVRFDDLPAGVDYAALDLCINSGAVRAGLILQGALVALGQSVKVDGHIGNATVEAAKLVPARKLIERICADRLTYMRTLAKWGRYGKGWTTRVNEVRAIATKMAASSAPLGLITVTEARSSRGADALKQAWTKIAGMKERLAALAGIAGERSADLLAQIQPFADVEAIKVVCTVLTVVSVTYGIYKLLQANGTPPAGAGETA
ncbi:lysozyme family protein [Methylorubrum extorquens]